MEERPRHIDPGATGVPGRRSSRLLIYASECGSPCVINRVIDVRYDRGVYLPTQNLWLDPWDAKPLAFVSHAHSDHIAPHSEIIVSERTARLMQARMPGERREHVVNFGERKTIHGLDITLIPEIGRASCRERGENSGGAGSLKKRNRT